MYKQASKPDEVRQYAIKLAVGHGIQHYKLDSLAKFNASIRKSLSHYKDIKDEEIAMAMTAILFSRIKMGW